MTPDDIARAILQLSPEGLIELKRLLDEHGPGGEAVGVREPRNMPPDEDEVAVALPEEYWKWAE